MCVLVYLIDWLFLCLFVFCFVWVFTIFFGGQELVFYPLCLCFGDGLLNCAFFWWDLRLVCLGRCVLFHFSTLNFIFWYFCFCLFGVFLSGYWNLWFYFDIRLFIYLIVVYFSWFFCLSCVSVKRRRGPTFQPQCLSRGWR